MLIYKNCSLKLSQFNLMKIDIIHTIRLTNSFQIIVRKVILTMRNCVEQSELNEEAVEKNCKKLQVLTQKQNRNSY